jgi:hypothetical protein
MTLNAGNAGVSCLIAEEHSLEKSKSLVRILSLNADFSL